MCGRFTLRALARVIAEQFGLPVVSPTGGSSAAEPEGRPFSPRFNIAPSQLVAVIRSAERAAARELTWMRWGLIPSWASNPSIEPYFLQHHFSKIISSLKLRV